MPVNIFDGSMGIQAVLHEPTSLTAMPEARQLAATVLHEAGLEEQYPVNTSWRSMEHALCPDVGDGDLLRPEVFTANLLACCEQFKDNRHPEVRSLLRDVLLPLKEDTDLLQTYTGLMIGG